MKKEPTQDQLRELYDYHESGCFVARRGRSHVKTGEKVIGYKLGKGYLAHRLNYTTFSMHRLIYIWHHGECPKYLDHINGIRHDNRIENLRPATLHQNAWNQRKGRSNTSGYKGVQWRSARNKWRALIVRNGRYKTLGHFNDPVKAAKAYDKAAREHDGEYACTNF